MMKHIAAAILNTALLFLIAHVVFLVAFQDQSNYYWMLMSSTFIWRVVILEFKQQKRGW